MKELERGCRFGEDLFVSMMAYHRLISSVAGLLIVAYLNTFEYTCDLIVHCDRL